MTTNVRLQNFFQGEMKEEKTVTNFLRLDELASHLKIFLRTCQPMSNMFFYVHHGWSAA